MSAKPKSFTILFIRIETRYAQAAAQSKVLCGPV